MTEPAFSWWPLSACLTGEGSVLGECLGGDELTYESSAASSLVFEVSVDLKDGQALGLDLDYNAEREVLPVRRVKSGVVEDWNSQRPEPWVASGDRLVAVNDARGRSNIILEELRRGGRLTLTFVRISSEKDEDDKRYVDAFGSWLKKSKEKPPVGARPKVPSLPLDRMANDPTVTGKPAAPLPPPLPAPWEKVWSESKQRYYYHNTETNETQWTVPGASSPSASKSAPSSSPSGPLTQAGDQSDLNIGLPAPWKAVWSSTRQRYYYLNTVTEESSWARPKAPEPSKATEPPKATPAAEPQPPEVAPEPAAASRPAKTKDADELKALNVGLPAGWQAVWSKSRQKYYYHNSAQNLNLWTRPDAEAPAPTPQEPTKPPPHADDESPASEKETDPNAGLPPGWQAAWSKSRKQYYYHNAATNTNTWERPELCGAPVTGPILSAVRAAGGA